MAKRKSSRQLETILGTVYRVSSAAAAVGIPRTTLITAINAGHVIAYNLADGTPVVRIADVIAYRDNPPTRGPRG